MEYKEKEKVVRLVLCCVHISNSIKLQFQTAKRFLIMRLSFKKYLVVTATLLCFSNFSLAGEVKTCAQKSGSTQDFGDATTTSSGATYGEACHETNAWQQLGVAKIAAPTVNNPNKKVKVALTGNQESTNTSWNAALSQSADTTNGNGTVDTGDNGVTWRVKGTTDWGRNANITQGDILEFKFVVQRATSGNHEFDELKAWVDWNGNGSFANDKSETLINEKWYKVDQHGGLNLDGTTKSYNNDWKVLNGAAKNTIYNSLDSIAIFKTEMQVPVTAALGRTWMRARIACENSITTYTDNMNLTATGYQDQGEVEDYRFNISARPPTPVPEPTTLFVFGTALIGLVLSRKKAK
jgi:hypothetical protein